MGIEKLAPQKGILPLPCIDIIYGHGHRYLPEVREFHYTHVYTYDGAQFFIGRFVGEKPSMVCITTGFFAVRPDETSGSVTKIVEAFKQKLKSSEKTIHEVIAYNKRRHMYIDLWEINFMII